MSERMSDEVFRTLVGMDPRRRKLYAEAARARAEEARLREQVGSIHHAAEEEIARLRAQIDAVREQHKLIPYYETSDHDPGGYCDACGLHGPCPTIRILDGAQGETR